MKLTIHNFAKIKAAELQLDGMTVICGDNNTGKSTVGKALATLIESFVDQEKTIRYARKQKIESIVDDELEDPLVFEMSQEYEQHLNKLIDNSISENELIKIVGKILSKNDDSEYVQSVVKKIMEVRAIPDSELKRQIVSTDFKNNFRGQHIPLISNLLDDTKLILENQDHKLKIVFPRNSDLIPVLKSDMEIRHHAFFVDSPDILDNINSYFRSIYIRKGNLNSLIVRALRTKIKDLSSNNVIDDYLINAKIRDIYEKISRVFVGSFILEPNKLTYHEDNMPGNLEISNLSKGMKAFALLKLLLEEHILKQEDILVLDEPEIHLHPAWQVIYAEILVLLQISFNLTVLLTTHSSYFLEAIQLFSRKYQQEKSLHIYKSSIQSNNGMATITEVDANATDIYASFMMPLDLLQELRNELKEKERNE